MSKPSFFTELKRRNVLRAAAFYAASAWLLVQVATQVFPFFHIAEWVVRWIVIAAIIGFPFAMGLAWFYEWTPQGIQRESDVEQDQSVTHSTGKKLDRWIIAILALAVVLLLTNQFVLHKDENVASAAQAPAKSIAVLPFENLSTDKDNAYFSNGITEEILDALAQIPNLKVAARRSAFQFKGNDLDLHKVGQALGVANILEGSVQKAGDQVRINVQLVDAQSGLQVWSEKYDRKLTNIFAIEDEISKAIADKLRVQLTGAGGQALVTVGTGNSQAHDLYLRGLNLLAARSMRDAADAFQQAVKLDPNYAQAWGEFAVTELLRASYEPGTFDVALSRAEAAAQRALTIDPNTASAYVALGNVRSSRMEWAKADQAFRHALALAPGDSEAVDQYAQFLYEIGQLEPGLREIERAQQLDPLSAIIGTMRASILESLHRDDAALAQIESVLAAHPDSFIAHGFAFFIYLDLGKYAEAEVHGRIAAKLTGADADAPVLLVRGMANPGLRAAALHSLETAPAHAVTRNDAVQYAFFLMRLGETQRALDQLEIADGKHIVFSSLLWNRTFDPLRNDPRFKAVLAKLGLPYRPANGSAP